MLLDYIIIITRIILLLMNKLYLFFYFCHIQRALAGASVSSRQGLPELVSLTPHETALAAECVRVIHP